MPENAYTRALSTPIPQSVQADSRQVPNSAGGFTFEVNDKDRLERILILGTERGTYYVDEKKLTDSSIAFIKSLIERDEQLVIDTVRDVSVSGRAFRNSNAIFVTAMLFAYGKVKPNSLVQDVCRIGTHIFEFATYIELLGGWGRAKRSAVAEWFTSKPVDKLAYDAVKYRQRDGWTHRDLARLAHPTGLELHVGRFVTGRPAPDHGEEIPVIAGFKEMQKADTVTKVLATLAFYPMLPWEAIPTEHLKNVDVWKQLFYNKALNGQALVRNITRLARIGAFNDMVFTRAYADRLTDVEMIKRTRLHPINFLQALNVHTEGQMNRVSGSRTKDWITNPTLVDALNAGFYKAFSFVEPTNKRTMIGLDVSGSMGGMCMNLNMSCAMVVAAMAMATARVEPYYQIYGFSDGTNRNGPVYYNSNSYNGSVLTDLGISPNMNLSDVMRKTADQNFGRTDCALPMLAALRDKVEVDTFIIYTDNETWCGNVHPHTALKNYRQKMGIDAKLAVVCCVPTQFTIADPTDRGMLDVVGADSNLPKLIAEFSAGRI